jgi:non-heme Fe2+,alpha-ketoglutarate-dependent halogenase
MTKRLTVDEVDRYGRDGILFPVDVLPADEAGTLLQRFESAERQHGGRLAGRINQKPHLLYPWMDQVVRDPAILDAVEDVLGPNLFCWGSQFFSKNAHDESYVSWHQDGTYWGLSSPDVVTAWVALTPSIPENGCMRVVPGTHKSQVPHADTFAQSNLLSRGQEVAVEVDLARAVDVVLRPGQMSLHHVLIFHGSEPNGSDMRRIGFAIRYVPTYVSQASGIRESALLVRGVDDFGNFDHETSPEAEMHPEAVARHKEVIDRQMQILYAGARQKGKREIA